MAKNKNTTKNQTGQGNNPITFEKLTTDPVLEQVGIDTSEFGDDDTSGTGGNVKSGTGGDSKTQEELLRSGLDKLTSAGPERIKEELAEAKGEQPSQAETTDFTANQENLQRGAENEEVGELQEFLNEQADANLTLDEKFGPRTAAAVRRFQGSQDLATDSIFGPNTRSKAQEVLEGTKAQQTGSGAQPQQQPKPGSDSVTATSDSEDQKQSEVQEALDNFSQAVTESDEVEEKVRENLRKQQQQLEEEQQRRIEKERQQTQQEIQQKKATQESEEASIRNNLIQSGAIPALNTTAASAIQSVNNTHEQEIDTLRQQRDVQIQKIRDDIREKNLQLAEKRLKSTRKTQENIINLKEQRVETALDIVKENRKRQEMLIDQQQAQLTDDIKEFQFYKRRGGTQDFASFKRDLDSARSDFETPRIIDQATAVKFGLPTSFVGKTSASLIKDIENNEEPPDWFNEMAQAQASNGLKQEELNKYWKQFKNNPRILAFRNSVDIDEGGEERYDPKGVVDETTETGTTTDTDTTTDTGTTTETKMTEFINNIGF